MPNTKNKKSVRVSSSKTNRATKEKVYESDSTYFLKLVVCVLLGTLWLKFSVPINIAGASFNGLPVGMLFGLLLVSRFEKLQYDRKIWYAILLLITITSYFLPAGILI